MPAPDVQDTGVALALPTTSTFAEAGDRVMQTLLLYRRGFTVAELGALLPNLSAGGQGISEASVEALLRAGIRMLLGHVRRGARPARLSPKLWPPEAVREEILAQAAGSTGRARMRLLRAWLDEARSLDPAPRLPWMQG